MTWGRGGRLPRGWAWSPGGRCGRGPWGGPAGTGGQLESRGGICHKYLGPAVVSREPMIGGWLNYSAS